MELVVCGQQVNRGLQRTSEVTGGRFAGGRRWIPDVRFVQRRGSTQASATRLEHR
jgi:hypothetical protein